LNKTAFKAWEARRQDVTSEHQREMNKLQLMLDLRQETALALERCMQNYEQGERLMALIEAIPAETRAHYPELGWMRHWPLSIPEIWVRTQWLWRITTLGPWRVSLRFLLREDGEIVVQGQVLAHSWSEQPIHTRVYRLEKLSVIQQSQMIKSLQKL
jgi:hypothetical protein